jgi:hypothetical protein
MESNGLLDAPGRALAAAVRQRLAADRLVVAFVAEFSRGKSELINAIFFADTGRRVLPATPGRTTMCPVELAWDPQQPPALSLLPIETRAGGLSLAELRGRDPIPGTRCRWTRATPRRWPRAGRRSPGCSACRWPRPQRWASGATSTPKTIRRWTPHGTVEVPAWRHALINYPHPLLKRGLVVLDTPGLNAIGAEPELTLSLLPSAHATVFILAADAGVTRSDLAIWRDHLGDRAFERFVVLNKIDALADPLLDAAAVPRRSSASAPTPPHAGHR